MKTRAVQGAVAGALALGRFASLVLRCAAWVDQFLGGKRAPVIAIVSVFVLVAPWADRQLGAVVVSWVALAVFIMMWVLMALARIDALRDETGFHFSLLRRTLGEAWQSVGGWAARIAQASGGQKAMDLAKPVLFGGLVVAASASVAAAAGLEDDYVTAMQSWGAGALVVGLAIYLWGLSKLRKTANATGLTMDANSAPAAKQAVQAMPLVIDCRDSAAVANAASRSGHPLVAALLLELAKPWPRPYYGDEREYQDRLLKRLRVSMPEANPRTERWIGERERADMLLGDEAAGLLIEIKANATTKTMRDLVGQAWAYLRVWRGRGPMLLVLCKTEAEVATRLQEDLALMRREGHAVLAVLAAP